MIAIPPVPFLYLRHGETDWNAAGRAQGRSDIPLNANGVDQAEAASAILRNTRVDAIVASPLVRAAETARIVGEACNVAVTTDPDLMEVCFGVREGEAMAGWYEDWLAGIATPEGGEDFAMLVARASGVLARHLKPGTRTLFVAHGALFRAVRTVLGLPNDVRLANGVPLLSAFKQDVWSVTPVA